MTAIKKATQPQPELLLTGSIFVLWICFTIGCQSTQDSFPATYDYCINSEPPNKECFVSKRDPTSEHMELAQSIVDKQITHHDAASLPWNWGESTMMIGIESLYRITGTATYETYYTDWLDHHISSGYAIETSDQCPPAVLAMALYEKTERPSYKVVVDDVLDYLYHVAPRTEDGGISHLGLVPGFEPTLWLDSLFMFGNVLSRWGEQTGDPKFLDTFSEQFEIFHNHLAQTNGLFLHAHNWPFEQDTSIFWARGNAWLTAAGYEYLRIRYVRGERDDFVEQALAKQAQALVELQDSTSGLWWTLLTRPNEIYQETSATALIAFGLSRAYRYGFLDDGVLPTIASAIAGVKDNVSIAADGSPIIHGTSGPTTAGGYEMYSNVSQIDDLSYGIGAVVLALIETSGLPLAGQR